MSVEKGYNEWAAQYDTNTNATRDLDQHATVATLSRYAFSSAFELGCGTGKNTAFLLTKAQSVIAIDFSANMLALARKKINSEKVEFQQADITKPWQVNEASVDLVTASLVLEHIRDLNTVLHQAANALKPKGLLFICELHPYKQYIGSKARFENANAVKVLEAYTHHTSEYLEVAADCGFQLLELKEWFDEGINPPIPRLISFVFERFS